MRQPLETGHITITLLVLIHGNTVSKGSKRRETSKNQHAEHAPEECGVRGARDEQLHHRARQHATEEEGAVEVVEVEDTRHQEEGNVVEQVAKEVPVGRAEGSLTELHLLGGYGRINLIR